MTKPTLPADLDAFRDALLGLAAAAYIAGFVAALQIALGRLLY